MVSEASVSLGFFGPPDQDGFLVPDDLMNGSMMGPMPDDEMPPRRAPRIVWSVRDVLVRSPGASATVAEATAGTTGMAAGMAVCRDLWSTVTAHGSAEHGPVFFAWCVRCSEFLGDINAHCRRLIDGLGETFFYIGITENPERRFEEHEALGNWSLMHVLLEAQTSATTGAYEHQLLDHYLRSPRCLNIGPGSERMSSGSPHYLYVIVNTITPLIRRRR